jgi:hypothetical protein
MASLILTSAADEGARSSSSSGRFTTEKEPRKSLKRRLCRPQSQSGLFEEKRIEFEVDFFNFFCQFSHIYILKNKRQ